MSSARCHFKNRSWLRRPSWKHVASTCQTRTTTTHPPAFFFPLSYRGRVASVKGAVDIRPPSIDTIPSPLAVLHDFFIVNLTGQQRGSLYTIAFMRACDT